MVPGYDDKGSPQDTCEYYNGTTFISVPGTMSIPRVGHTASLYGGDSVLVCGGASSVASQDDSCDVVTLGGISPITRMRERRVDHSAVNIDLNTVLICGGDSSLTCEVFEGGFWTPFQEMMNVRSLFPLALTSDCYFLACGGYNRGQGRAISQCERIYVSDKDG